MASCRAAIQPKRANEFQARRRVFPGVDKSFVGRKPQRFRRQVKMEEKHSGGCERPYCLVCHQFFGTAGRGMRINGNGRPSRWK